MNPMDQIDDRNIEGQKTVLGRSPEGDEIVMWVNPETGETALWDPEAEVKLLYGRPGFREIDEFPGLGIFWQRRG